MKVDPTCVAPHCDKPVAQGSFCARHFLEPAGKRGGWLSAARRRVVRSNPPPGHTEPLDASCIARRLWVGARPPYERALPAFDALVLCAREIQPPADKVGFKGRIIRCPLPDDELNAQEIKLSLAAGKRVAAMLVAGDSVLVTCQMGLNRSALVACLGLGLVTRLSAAELVEIVRDKRDRDCLSNRHFVTMLERYIGAGRRAPLAALP